MIKLDYKSLKSNYSTDPTSIHRCTMHFPNTCAIRMSEAIVKTESKFLDMFRNAGTNICPHSYIRGAQDLAAVLAKDNALGTRTHGWNGSPAERTPNFVTGKKGIICYMNIPGYSGQGHIDLWDGSGPVGSEYWDAQTIWLWELK